MVGELGGGGGGGTVLFVLPNPTVGKQIETGLQTVEMACARAVKGPLIERPGWFLFTP